MKRKTLFFSLTMLFLLVLLTPIKTLAKEVTCFTDTFTRGTGEPIIQTSDPFPGISGPAIIRLWNGAENDEETGEKVSSSTILVNGNVVFDSSNLSQNVDYLEATVNLNEGNNNICQVMLKSKPGGKVRIQIVQEVSVSSVIMDPDLNDDGIVNTSDVEIVNTSIGKNAGDKGYDFRADTDLDGDVDNDDLNYIEKNLGTTYPASKIPDSDMIVEEDGIEYPVNEVLVFFDENEGRNTAEDVVSSIGGIIVGFSPSLNAYQVQVPTSTVQELDQLINDLSLDARVQAVAKNILCEPSGSTDLTNLGNINPDLIDTYDKIRIREAWKLMESSELELSPIKIGVIDSGIDLDHPEFEGVDVYRPFLQGNDIDGHGTSVCGIIGANNISATEEYVPPQMNGIVSGIPGLQYSLYVEKKGVLSNDESLIGIPGRIQYSIFGYWVTIDELARQNVRIINMSQAKKLPTLLYDFYKSKFEKEFAKHPDIIFVVAAGNESVDMDHVIPGSVELGNVITVGGTDITDERWSFLEDGSVRGSNFGSVIDIAAPAVNIYAPKLYKEPLDINDYDGFTGTSGAAPMVTGVAAILLSMNPELTPKQVKNILWQTGDEITTDQPISGKRLNALKAVSAVLDSDGDGVLDNGDFSEIIGDNPCTGGQIANCDDNCPNTYNPDQADSDGDGVGDACSEPQYGFTQRATITVDGNSADWAGLAPAIVDPSGDNIGGPSYDIWKVYTAMDDSYAYVMVETYGKPFPQDALVEINFDYKPGQHLVHGAEKLADLTTNITANNELFAWNDEQLDGTIEPFPISGYSVARGNVFEASIPLSQIENAQYFNATFINIWSPPYEAPGNDPTDICIQIPTRTITIDGLASDWDGIAPILNDAQGDSSCGVGGDVKSLYLAKDSDYLYWRLDTWSGTFDLQSGSGSGPGLVFYSTSGDGQMLRGVDASVTGSNDNGAVAQRYANTDWTFVIGGPEYGKVDEIAEGKIPLYLFNNFDFNSVDGWYFPGTGSISCDDVTRYGSLDLP